MEHSTMSALRPETRRLIELAREGDRPSPGVQRKVERALAAKALLLGGAAAGGAVVTTSAAASALIKPLAVVVSLALGVAAAQYGGARLLGSTTAATPGAAASTLQPTATLLERTPAATSAEERLPEPASSAPPAEAQVVAPSRATPTPRRAKSGESPQADRDTLRAETSGLRAAQKALRDGDAAGALDFLATEAARHPNGALVQERAAARVLALCQSGNVAAARNEAREFEALYPTSPLLVRVRAACVERRVAP
jgi:hypothetical protein